MMVSKFPNPLTLINKLIKKIKLKKPALLALASLMVLASSAVAIYWTNSKLKAWAFHYLTIDTFTASDYDLESTGVTYTVTFEAPTDIASGTRIEFRLDTNYNAPLESYCSASLASNQITDDGSGIAANFDPADESDGICRFAHIIPQENIANGSTVTITVNDVVNPQIAGKFFADLSFTLAESHRYITTSENSTHQVFDDPSNPSLLGKIKVVDPTSSPVEDVYIWVHNANYSQTAGLSTGSDGVAYLFPSNFYDEGSVEGEYQVEIQAPSGSDYTDPTGSYTLTLSSGSTDTNHFDTPVSLTRPQFSGTIVVPSYTDETCGLCSATIGESIANVSVDVHDSTLNPANSKYFSTDQNGEFKIGGLAAGTYRAEFRMPPDAGEYLGLTAPDSMNFTVNEDGSVTYDESDTAADNLPVALGDVGLKIATKTVTGQITKSDGTAVTSARIMAFNMNGNGMAETTTNDTGHYTLVMGGGSWNIRPEIDFSSNFDDDDSNDVNADWTYCGMGRSVSFADDQTTESKTGNFKVKETAGTITGKVVYPGGEPVSDSASVNVFSKDGCGAFAPLDWGTGRFSVAVPAGTYNVSAEVWDQDYSSPAPKTVTASSGTTDVGTLTLLEKQARISGRVWADINGDGSYNSGEGISGTMVESFKMNKKFDPHGGPGPGPGPMGGGFAHTQSDANGNFTLKVTKGTWMVNVMADMGMMHGGYSENSTNYIYTGAPEQVAISTDTTNSTAHNFQLQVADATINGRLFADSNDNDQYDDGEGVSGIWGFAFAEPAGTYNQGPMMGAGMGAPINNGVFQIKVPAGDYQVGTDFPPENTSYTPSSMTEVSVSSGGEVAANVEVLPNNATLRVQFKDESGDLVTSLAHAEVFLDNPGGGHQYRMFTSEELNTGYADIAVSEGNWRIGYFIDPTESNYMSSPTTDNVVTTVADQTVTRNITLSEANATVSGTVKDPSGSPLSGVFVSVDNRKSDNFDPMGMMFAQGEVTAADGSYSLNLPEGTYKVQAFFPPEAVVSGETVNYLNPEPQEVTLSSGTPATANFNFKQSDATLAGTVLLNGSSQGAFISAYSDQGGYNETTSSNGSFSLNVTKNATWYLRAFYEDDNTVYLSDVVSVAMGDSSSKTQNLNLEQAPFTIPDAVSTSFNCANAKKITLSNGAEISIPASAIQPSSINACDNTSAQSNITLTVSPTTQMSLQDKSVPIGVGYEVTAMDSNGANISDTFNSNVTLTIPYSDQEMETSLGGGAVDESLLGNGYWDTSTSSWRNVSNEVLDTDSNQLTISTNHFTLFSVLAATDPNSTAGDGTDSSSSSSSTSVSQPEGCSKTPPRGKAPWLYAALPESSTSIRLYFADADGPMDRYVLIYGLESNSYLWGANDIGGPGTRTYLVQHLQPNTTYHFRVRAGNDCAVGAWSNELSGTTKTAYNAWSSYNLTSDKAEAKKPELKTKQDNCQYYQVQAGDSLWSIAQQVYGDGADFQKLIDLNQDQYPALSDSKLVDVGWQLKTSCEEVKIEDDGQEDESGAVKANQDEQDTETQAQSEKQEGSTPWKKYLGWTTLGIIGLLAVYFVLTKLLF